LYFLIPLFLIPLKLQAQTVTSTSDLLFPAAVQGDSSRTIASGSSENASNGSFRIAGNANQSFTIILPSTPVVLTTTGGGVNTLSLTNFTSFPATTGVLSATGRRNVFIGATRSAVANNQTPGSYTGSYTINIIY
jgi:hypothetical protein